MFDVVSVGETMAMLTPVDAQPVQGESLLRLTVGGAESNVVCGLASMGYRTAWVGRLGADPFADIVRARLGECGVDLDAVEIDPARPTGLYLKDPHPDGTQVHYYRRGSAASAMGPELADLPVVRNTRIVHVSGITPALSQSCAELIDALLLDRRAGGPLVSFDVNYRPALWPAGQAASVLLPLARAADLVLVGRDEAAALWGTATADDVRALLPEVARLVVKDAEHGATAYDGAERTFSPAPRVRVVEPVGAGDAFAAGYLAGLLDGRPARDRLRLGHLAAAAVLGIAGDLVPPPSSAECERHLARSDEDWAALDFRVLSTVEEVS
jgi:2-dehydro-3-deoxygluconokinase